MRRHPLSKRISIIVLTFAISFILIFAVISIMVMPVHALINSGDSSNANERRGVYLNDIHTVPGNIHVADTFKLNATVINNSENTIVFARACGPTATATFDRAVIKENATACNILIIPEQLSPGQKTTIEIPSTFGGLFKATEPGMVHSELVFPYRIQGEPMSIVIVNTTAPYTFQVNRESSPLS